ncbi:MAG: MFS transporter [Actinomycetales bacterium]|nr:MFS transporter [Actinomycetales bacterium]
MPSAAPTVVVLAGGVAAALHLGKLPPAVPVLQVELGMTLVEAGFLLALIQLAGMLLGLVMGLAADGAGLRRSVITGLTVLSLAGAASGFTHSVAGLLALRAVEGLGFLLATVPAPGLLRRVVRPDRVTRVLGMWGAYVPFGTALGLLVGPRVLAGASWPVWWWLVAATTAAMAVAIAVVVPADPPAVSRTGGGPRWQARAAQTVRNRGPWLGALSFCLYAAQWMAVIGFLPTLYAASGWGGAVGATLSATVAAANVVGNVAAGQVLHRGWRPDVVITLGFAGQAVGTFLAFASLTADAPAARFVGALVFSAVGGLVPGAVFGLAPRLAPSEPTISTTVGWIQQWSSAGQVAGPPVVAWIASSLGGWQWTWVVSLVCCLGGAVLASALHRHLVAASPR